MGVTEILTIVFIVLKLIGVINWSWWLVLLPGIIGLVFYAIVGVLGFLSVEDILPKKRRSKK